MQWEPTKLKRWTIMTWVFFQGYLMMRGNLKTFFKHFIECFFSYMTLIHALHKTCLSTVVHVHQNV